MKSNCCNAPMSVGGDGTGEGATHFWVCEKCCEACNPATVTRIGTYQPLGEGVCAFQRVVFDPPIQVSSDQDLIVEGNKATVQPSTEPLRKLAQIEVNKALKAFNQSHHPYVATLATDVEISMIVTDDLIPETPPILE